MNVLEAVWAEGFEAGRDYSDGSTGYPPNPYATSATPDEVDHRRDWIPFYQRLESRHPENKAEHNRDLAKRIVRILANRETTE